LTVSSAETSIKTSRDAKDFRVRRKTIFLTLEHKEREFVPKILLARLFVDAGYRVYLGSSEAIGALAKKAGPGVFFHKSTHPRSVEFRQLGHKFVFLDEEGGVTTPRSTIEDFCLWRYKTLSRDRQDMVLLPNQAFMDVVKSMPNSDGVELRVTGWARVDLWRMEFAPLFSKEIRQHIDDYGDFYLFVSSFGASDPQGFARLISEDSPTEKFRSISEHKRDSFVNYVELIRQLSGILPFDRKIVVRPHPSESLESWERLFEDCSNVIVVRHGDVASWIHASKGVIHFGSTAATQTVLAGKPAVSYKVKRLKGVTDSPSFDLVPNVDSASEVLRVLDSNATGRDAHSLRSKALVTLRRYMDFDPDVLAAEKIVSAVESLESKLIPRPNITLNLLIWLVVFQSMTRVKTMMKRWGFIKYQGKTVFENLDGGIMASEVVDYVRRLDEILGLNTATRVRQVTAYIVEIE
jgi:surface carbohydrate biosynthesis protein